MDAINTFASGMQRDLDKSLLKSTMAHNIENFRLTSRDGSSTGALENVKGNVLSEVIPDISNMYFIKLYVAKLPVTVPVTINLFTVNFVYTQNTTSTDLYNFFNNTFCDIASVHYISGLSIKFINNTVILYSTSISFTLSIPLINNIYYLTITTLPAQSNLRIIGYANIRNTTVLFTTSCVHEDPDLIRTYGYGQLWKLEYSDAQAVPTPTLTLLYNGLLGFSDYHPVEALGRYERENIQKVYWVDNFNYYRSCNIQELDLMLREPTSFDMVNDISLTTPILETVSRGGTYLTGVVQYSYQLYNQYGQQSSFSSCSNLVHLVSSDEWTTVSKDYKGEDVEVDTGKSVSILINSLDERFDSIKVVAIHWTTLNATPAIRYVYDGTISDTNQIKVIDDGSITYGSLTVDEFNSIGGAVVIPKTIASKNDYMFLFNLKEPNWDITFDARAYRFNTVGQSLVFDKTGAATPVLVTDPYWGVPLEHDAIAPINSDLASVYKLNTLTGNIGGTGPNVSFEMKTVEVNIDDAGNVGSQAEGSTTYSGNSKVDYVVNGVTYNNDSFSNSASPAVDGLIRGYQRDEIYRFGIVFFNKKHIPSFVHWIADIRMPHQRDAGYSIVRYANNSTYGVYLYPEFRVDLSSLSTDDAAQVDSFSIVRVVRSGSDRTVIANGSLIPMKQNTADNNNDAPTLIDEFVGGNWIKDFFEFDSPEINFNKNITFKTGDYIDVIGGHKDTTYWNTLALSFKKQYFFKSRDIAEYTNTPADITQYKWDLIDSKITGVSYGDIYDVGGNVYRNYWTDTGNTNQFMHGTTMAVKCNGATPFATTPVGQQYNLMAVNYKRTLISQYGGNTWNARYNNEYIECANTKLVSGTSVYTTSVFNGDTYICMYDYLSFILDQGAVDNSEWSVQEVRYFPVETSINLFLRSDTCYSKNGDDLMLCESFNMGVDQYGSTVYPTDFTDLYLYNSVYSQENTLRGFYTKPFNFEVEENHDVTIISSQKKFNGELIDNWTTFYPNDRKEVDSNYGKINKALNFKNYIFFWQDRAVGIQSIEPRSLTTDTNPAPLTLGLGEVLDRHDYLSTDIGCQHQWAVCNSKDSIAWFDMNKRKMYRYTDAIKAISDVGGLQSFFANQFIGTIAIIDNPIHDTSIGLLQSQAGINCVYDDRYNEYLFTFSETKIVSGHLVYEYFTLAFNDSLDAFTSFYSYDPALYIKTWNKLITVPKNALNELWLHDYGDWGSFYGDLVDSKIEYLVKDNYIYTKVFDAIEYAADVTYNNIDLLKEGFNQVRFYNSYQNTDWYTTHYYDGTIPLPGYIDVTRRETTWNLAIPRNAVLLSLPSDPDIFNQANLDQTRPFRERIRDNYLFTSLVYNNADTLGNAKNYRMVLPYVLTKYRVSQR